MGVLGINKDWMETKYLCIKKLCGFFFNNHTFSYTMPSSLQAFQNVETQKQHSSKQSSSFQLL